MEQKILELIDSIAKLAPELFKILVRQVMVTASVNLILSVLFIVFTIWGVRKVYFYTQNFNKINATKDRYNQECYSGWMTTLAIGCGIGGLIGFILLITGIVRILNPEYYAIMNFIKTSFYIIG